MRAPHLPPGSPPERPRVLYFSRIDFPSPKANSIQTLNTCYEMARAGADVVLVVRRLLRPRRQCFEWYGLPEHPRLRFVSLSLPIDSEFNDWRGTYFRFYLASMLRKYRSRQTILYSRDPAGTELLHEYASLRPHPGLRTFFEVHKLSFLTKADHQTERGRSLDDPKVQRKLEARRQLEAGVYARVDGLVCTSESAARLLDEHFPDHAPACVVPNGTRLERGADGSLQVESELDDRSRDLEVLYVGQLYRWKGIDTLVEAMAHLPGMRLSIVGGNDDADLERLRGRAAALGVSGRVDFLGSVSPHRVPDFLRRARVGVVPLPLAGSVEAAYFTSPLKLFELMQGGVPIVASDLPSVRELVRHGHSAHLVPPDDAAALAAGIETVLRDRDYAARLVREAAARVRDYTWERRAERILEFAFAPMASERAGEA